MWRTVDWFYLKGTFTRSLNSTFNALVPKKKGVGEVKDFKPISLLGTVYKIFVEFMAERLKKLRK